MDPNTGKRLIGADTKPVLEWRAGRIGGRPKLVVNRGRIARMARRCERLPKRLASRPRVLAGCCGPCDDFNAGSARVKIVNSPDTEQIESHRLL
jgi:hypothetical protein